MMESLDPSKKARPSLFESFNIQDSDSSGGKASPTPLKQINWDKLSASSKTSVRNGDVSNKSQKSEKECIVIDIDDSASENSNSGQNTPCIVGQAGNNTGDVNENKNVQNRDNVFTVLSQPEAHSHGDHDKTMGSNLSSGSVSKARKLTQGKIDGFFQKSPPPVCLSTEKTSVQSQSVCESSKSAQNGQIKLSEQKTESEKSKSEKGHHRESSKSGHHKKDRSHSHSSSKRHQSEKSSKSSGEKHSSSQRSSHHKHTKSTGSHSQNSEIRKSEGQDLRTFNMFEVTNMSLAKRLKQGDSDKVSPAKKSHSSLLGSERLKQGDSDKVSPGKKAHSSLLGSERLKPGDSDKVSPAKKAHSSLLGSERLKQGDSDKVSPAKKAHSSLLGSDKFSKDKPPKTEDVRKDKVNDKEIKPSSSHEKSRPKSREKVSNSTREHSKVLEANSKSLEKSRHSSKSSKSSKSSPDKMTPSKSASHSKDRGHSEDKRTPQKPHSSGKKDNKGDARRSSSGQLITPEMIYSQVYGSYVPAPKVKTTPRLGSMTTPPKVEQKSGEQVHKKHSKDNLANDNVPKNVLENRAHDYWTSKTVQPDSDYWTPKADTHSDKGDGESSQVVGKSSHQSDKSEGLKREVRGSKSHRKKTDLVDEKMSLDILNMLMEPRDTESSPSKSVSQNVVPSKSAQVSNEVVNEVKPDNSNAAEKNLFAIMVDVSMGKANDEAGVDDSSSHNSKDSQSNSETGAAGSPLVTQELNKVADVTSVEAIRVVCADNSSKDFEAPDCQGKSRSSNKEETTVPASFLKVGEIGSKTWNSNESNKIQQDKITIGKLETNVCMSKSDSFEDEKHESVTDGPNLPLTHAEQLSKFVSPTLSVSLGPVEEHGDISTSVEELVDISPPVPPAHVRDLGGVSGSVPIVKSSSSDLPVDDQSISVRTASAGDEQAAIESDIVSLGGSSVFDDTTSNCVQMDETSEVDYETYLTIISDASEKDDKSSVSGLSIRTTTSADVSSSMSFNDVSNDTVADKATTTIQSKIPMQKVHQTDLINDNEFRSSDGPVDHKEKSDEVKSADGLPEGEVTGAASAVSIGKVILVNDDDTVPFGDEVCPVGQACELLTSFSSLKNLGVDHEENSLHLHLSSEDSQDSVSGEIQCSATVENITFPVRVGASPELYANAFVEDEDHNLDQDQLNCSSESVIVSCVIEGNEVKGCVEEVDLVCVQGEEGPILVMEEQDKSLNPMAVEEDGILFSNISPRDSTLASVIEAEEYHAESVDDLLSESDNVLKESEDTEQESLFPMPERVETHLEKTPSEQPLKSVEKSCDEPSDNIVGNEPSVSSAPSKNYDQTISLIEKTLHDSCKSPVELSVASEAVTKSKRLVSEAKTSSVDVPVSDSATVLPELSNSLLQETALSKSDVDKKDATKISKATESSGSSSSEEEEEITPRRTRSHTRTSESQSEFSSPAPRIPKLTRSFKAGDKSKKLPPVKTVSNKSPSDRKITKLQAVSKEATRVKKPANRSVAAKDADLESESELGIVEKNICKNVSDLQGDQTNSASDTGEQVRKSSRKRKVKSMGDDVIVFAEAGTMKSDFYTKAHQHFPKKITDVESLNVSPSVSKDTARPAKSNLPTPKTNLVEKEKVRSKKTEKGSVGEKDSKDEPVRRLRSPAKAEVHSPVRELRRGLPSTPEKSSAERLKSVGFIKCVAGKENILSNKRRSVDTKVVRRVSDGDKKRGRTLSCDDQKLKSSSSKLKSDAKLSPKRKKDEEQCLKKSNDSYVKRGRGRPRKGEFVLKAQKVEKTIKDVKKLKRSDSSDKSDDSENDREMVDDDEDDFTAGSESDSEGSTDAESESNSDSDSSAGPGRRKKPGKYSYKKDDDYTPANVGVGVRKRGRPRKSVFRPSDSERDSSEEFQSNQRPLKRKLKLLSPAAKVARSSRKTDALTAAEAAAAKQKAEKERVKNRHRNLIKKAISTQNHQKLKMKPFRRKQVRAILVGERKRLERGAKNRVSMYYSDGMEDMASDYSEGKSSSSSDDYLNDIYTLFGGDLADATLADGSDQELDSSIIQNPLNIPYYPEIREAALSGEQNNNCLLVFNDDTHWNDVAEEMPSRCATICAKFTGAVVTSIQYQFRDDDCSGYDSDEPAAKRTRKSKRKDTSSPSSKLGLKKKNMRNEKKTFDKTPVKLTGREKILSSRDEQRRVRTNRNQTVVLELQDIMKRPSPSGDKTKNLSGVTSDLESTLIKGKNGSEPRNNTPGSDSSVVIIHSDNSQSPRKKDLMKDRKGVLGLYEEFMSMLHTEKKQDDGGIVCLDTTECAKRDRTNPPGNDTSSVSAQNAAVHNAGQLSSGNVEKRTSSAASWPNSKPVSQPVDCDSGISANDENENISKSSTDAKILKRIIKFSAIRELTKSFSPDKKQTCRDASSSSCKSAMVKKIDIPAKGTNQINKDIGCDKNTNTARDSHLTSVGHQDTNNASVREKDTAVCDKETSPFNANVGKKDASVGDIDMDTKEANVSESNAVPCVSEPNQIAAAGDGEDTYILVDCDGELVCNEQINIMDLTGESDVAFLVSNTSVLSTEETLSAADDPMVRELVDAINIDHNYARKKESNQVWVREQDYKAGAFNAAVDLQDIGPLLTFSNEVGAFVENEARLTFNVQERIQPKQDEPDANCQ